LPEEEPSDVEPSGKPVAPSAAAPTIVTEALVVQTNTETTTSAEGPDADMSREPTEPGIAAPTILTEALVVQTDTETTISAEPDAIVPIDDSVLIIRTPALILESAP
jgi:hypothetical protein